MNEEMNNDSVIWDLVIGMLIFGAIIEIIVLIVSETILFHSIGIWIGVAVGIIMSIHMKRSIEDALDIGEEHAAKHMMKKSIMRNCIVVAAFLLLGYTQVGSMLTALLGVLGLKISVYLQPYIYKVRRNLRKGGR
ncbi:MAG: hypothetical protein R3Y40_03025 [Eubacteriales bacterium]